MADQFSSDANERGGSPMGFNTDASADERGGTGSDGQDSKIHSAAGFRRAIMKTQRSGNSLKDQMLNQKDFSGKGFTKPNYFAQGGGRHGMHIGSGAPAIRGASQVGVGDESFGGE